MLTPLTTLVSVDPAEILALKADVDRKIIEVWFRDPAVGVLPISFKGVDPPLRHQDMERTLAELTAIVSQRRPDFVSVSPTQSVPVAQVQSREEAE